MRPEDVPVCGLPKGEGPEMKRRRQPRVYQVVSVCVKVCRKIKQVVRKKKRKGR